MHITQYLQKHRAIPQTAGKSGAEVYDLDNGTTAKFVRRDAVSAELWNSCIREARFYEEICRRKLPYLPDIIHLAITEQEILIVMRRYTPMTADRLTPQMLTEIFSALASLHREVPPAHLLSEASPKTPYIDRETADACAAGWTSVLAEHGSVFSADAAFPVLAAEQFNRINEQCTLKHPVLCHGDFHIGNLLVDDANHPIFCDFQSCGMGDGCGDLSFFLSRLSTDGIPIEHDRVIGIYSEQSGLPVSEIKKRMALSDFNTAFLFWHTYLHGSDAARVHTVFDAMKADYEQLTAEECSAAEKS